MSVSVFIYFDHIWITCGPHEGLRHALEWKCWHQEVQIQHPSSFSLSFSLEIGKNEGRRWSITHWNSLLILYTPLKKFCPNHQHRHLNRLPGPHHPIFTGSVSLLRMITKILFSVYHVQLLSTVLIRGIAFFFFIPGNCLHLEAILHCCLSIRRERDV